MLFHLDTVSEVAEFPLLINNFPLFLCVFVISACSSWLLSHFLRKRLLCLIFISSPTRGTQYLEPSVSHKASPGLNSTLGRKFPPPSSFLPSLENWPETTETLRKELHPFELRPSDTSSDQTPSSWLLPPTVCYPASYFIRLLHLSLLHSL